MQKNLENLENYLKQIIPSNRKIQLTLIYFFAASVLTNTAIDFFGDYPSIIEENLELLKSFISSGFNFFQDPSRQYLFYLLSMEYLIIRPLYKFQRIVRFNLLLALTIEMFFLLVASCWDTVTSREVEFIEPFELDSDDEDVEGDDFEEEDDIEDFDSDDSFYSVTWSSFFAMYIYCYIFAFLNKYPKIPSKFSKLFPIFQLTIDSISFWFWREKKAI